MPTVPYINAENASAIALLRWRNPRPKPAIVEHDAANDAIAKQAERAHEQLERLNKLIDKCTDAKEQDALTRAKERQFRIWARLAQLPSDPKPVQLKAGPARRTYAEPTLAEPSQAQANPGPGPAPTKPSPQGQS